MDTKKVFVIVVALEKGKFEHYLTEPKIFYETRAEAQHELEQLIQQKEFNKNQLKILILWTIENTI